MRKCSLVPVAVVLSMTLIFVGCRKADSQAEESTSKEPPPSSSSTDGSEELKKFFPPEGSLRCQTKPVSAYGKIAYSLVSGESELGRMEISDVSVGGHMKLTESARLKFAQATEKIEGQPVVDEGGQYSLLVNNRFLVQVRRAGGTGGIEDAELRGILSKFDVKGLAKL